MTTGRQDKKLGRSSIKLAHSVFRVFIHVLFVLTSIISAFYLRSDNRELWNLTLLAAIVLAARSLSHSYQLLNKQEYALIGMFALLLSVSIVLGFHIQITGSTYDGSVLENFVSPYSWFDVAALVCIWLDASVLALAIYGKLKATGSRIQICMNPICARRVCLFALVIFLIWMPYLFAWWPGFVLSDSIASIGQALSGSWVDYSNHHPVVYTLFIKLCFRIVWLFGLDITWGSALSTLIQMMLVSLSLGYCSAWLEQRVGSVKLGWGLTLIFALSSYMGSASAAMWKDPLFSCGLLLMTLQLYDLFHLERHSPPFRWFLLLFISSFFVGFWRSNGVYILVAVAVAIAGYAIAKFVTRSLDNSFFQGNAEQPEGTQFGEFRYAVSAVILIVLSAFQLILTGPVYNSLGITSDSKVEALGIPINQIARVVALDGEMTEDDKQFFEELIPAQRVKEVYSPTCVDLVKWDGQFNGEILEHEGFWSRWLSLLIRNPRVFFEAWELQTCGFWTVNVPQAINSTNNVSGGVIWNLREDSLRDLSGIRADNQLDSDIARQLYTYSAKSIPVGVITWMLLFLCVCVICRKNWKLFVVLTPSIGLLATLLVASPIWYWSRYGMAMQLLVPFYLFLLVKVAGKGDSNKRLQASKPLHMKR